MKVLLARHSGFCDGVKRAMRIALEAADHCGGLQADGPLVHNRAAVRLLELRGISDAPDSRRDNLPILIRAHGVAPERRAAWEEAGRTLVDATCAHVARNQRLARDQAAGGRRIIFAGDREHAETKAVTGSAGAACDVVASPEEVERLDAGGSVFLLAQTTFDVEAFHDIARAVKNRFPDAVVRDTICRATRIRQSEAAELAARSDALVAVGGRNSANTKRLAEAGRAAGKPVFLVETASELGSADFESFRVVGVISGASTPGWITQDVVNRLRDMGRTPLLSQGARLLQRLVESRVTLALAAGGLALGSGFLAGRELSPAPAVMGACYVFFAHTLNRRLPRDPEARRLSLSDPLQRTRRSPLPALGWLAAGVSVVLSLFEGKATAALYAALILAAAALALVRRGPPARFAKRGRFAVAGNWPMAAGWTLALAFPLVQRQAGLWPFAAAAVFVFSLCLGGALVRDLHDIVGDKLIGIDTIPARMGVMPARKLAALAFGVAAALPFLVAAVAAIGGEGLSPWFLFVLLAPVVPALGYPLLDATEKRGVTDVVMIRAGVDAMGCLYGLLALVMGSLA